jgi:glycosyltransferase involved in cell wall biosynthesis
MIHSRIRDLGQPFRTLGSRGTSETTAKEGTGRKMRVTIAAEHDDVGAAETYAFTLALGLSERAADVQLWVLRPIREAATRWVKGSPVRVLEIPESNRDRFLFARHNFMRQRPAVVHVNHAVSPVLMGARAAGVPARLVTDHVLPLRPSYNIRGEVLRQLTRVSCTAVVVFSEQNAIVASGTWGRTPVKVIYPGVPQPTCSLDRATVRASIGVPADAILVTTVGRLTEQKRMDVFIRALAEVRHPRLHGLIAGEGNDRQDLERLVEASGMVGRITFVGHRDDVGCLLAASDLYVQVSAWEGICFAVLEAMATSLPCVGSDIGALREALGDVGAPYAPVGAVEPVATAIAALLADPDAAASLADRLRARWEQIFTVDRMCTAHLAAYVRRGEAATDA